MNLFENPRKTGLIILVCIVLVSFLFLYFKLRSNDIKDVSQRSSLETQKADLEFLVTSPAALSPTVKKGFLQNLVKNSPVGSKEAIAQKRTQLLSQIKTLNKTK